MARMCGTCNWFTPDDADRDPERENIKGSCNGVGTVWSWDDPHEDDSECSYK